MDVVNQAIEMISVCAVDGEIQPLRFRYEDARHHLHTVRVEEVLMVKEVKYVGLPGFQYFCRARVGQEEKLFELRYAVKTHRWVLFRMID